MILLQPDCLVFKTSHGENIPCSAQQVTVELIGESASVLDDEVIHNAAQAVLHYFKLELGKTLVSVGEFAQVLEKVLRGLGFEVRTAEVDGDADRIEEADLRLLASESGKAFELVFFQRLRQELRRQLDRSPKVMRFLGLRDCVKQLMGTKRWNPRCQNLNDQIVEYLRRCLNSEAGHNSCPLLVV
jgi:hypothetical protein